MDNDAIYQRTHMVTLDSRTLTTCSLQKYRMFLHLSGPSQPLGHRAASMAATALDTPMDIAKGGAEVQVTPLANTVPSKCVKLCLVLQLI